MSVCIVTNDFPFAVDILMFGQPCPSCVLFSWQQLPQPFHAMYGFPSWTLMELSQIRPTSPRPNHMTLAGCRQLLRQRRRAFFRCHPSFKSLKALLKLLLRAISSLQLLDNNALCIATVLPRSRYASTT